MSTNPETCAPFSHAFDREANDYAARWDAHPLVRLFRARVVEAVARATPPPARLLDLGCGIGTDAGLFAALGYDVVAVDSSAEMVRRAVESGARAICREIGEAGGLGLFDVVFSNFGALNCVPTPEAAGLVKATLRSGGVFLAVTMAARCPAEQVALAMRGRWPFRRGPEAPVQGVSVPLVYPTADTWKNVLGQGFRCDRVAALGALVAPPDLGGKVGVGSTLDALFAGVPVLRTLGDHTLVVFRRAA